MNVVVQKIIREGIGASSDDVFLRRDCETPFCPMPGIILQIDEDFSEEISSVTWDVAQQVAYCDVSYVEWVDSIEKLFNAVETAARNGWQIEKFGATEKLRQTIDVDAIWMKHPPQHVVEKIAGLAARNLPMKNLMIAMFQDHHGKSRSFRWSDLLGKEYQKRFAQRDDLMAFDENVRDTTGRVKTIVEVYLRSGSWE